MADATPYFGIAPFVLGMTRDTVHAAAGKPDSIETSRDGEARAIESWFYREQEIELEFDEAPDARLESITASSAGTTINGVAIIDCDTADLKKLAAQADITDLELTDDFGDSGKCFQSEQHGLMFWAVKGKIVNVTLFPRFDDEGEEPQWPT